MNSSSLQLLRRGSGPVCLLVPGSDGNAAVFLPLAGRLAPGPEVFAYQCHGLALGEQPRATVEEIAAAYLKEAVQARPRGPYLLAGWSMGAFVALEMAHQAAELGLQILGLHLIAPAVPGEGGFRRQRRVRQELKHHLRQTHQRLNTLKQEPDETLPLWDLSDDPLDEPHETLPASEHQLRRDLVNLNNLHAGAVYRAPRGRRAWRGQTVLYLPTDDPAPAQTFWGQVVRPRPEIVALPGSHHHAIQGAAAQIIAAHLAPGPASGSKPTKQPTTEDGVLQ